MKEDEIIPAHTADGFFVDGMQTWQVIHIGHLVSCYGNATGLKPEKFAAHIECHIGVGLSKDTLKRFLDRLHGDQKDYAQQSTSRETTEKLASFLAHSKVGLLNLDHLRFCNFVTTAPIAFINTLLFNHDKVLPRLHPSYDGTYTLVTQKGSEGLGAVFSISTKDDQDWFVVRLRMTSTSQKSGNLETRLHEGWGVLPPENNLFIHLKSTGSGQNMLLSAAASPLNFAGPREPFERLVLHHLSDPLEIVDWTDELPIETDASGIEKIYKFQWHREFFLEDEQISDIILETGEEPAETRQKWIGLSKGNPLLKNSRFVDQQKASEREKDKFDAFDMEKKERYLGQRFLRAVQDIDNTGDDLAKILGDGKALNAQDPFNDFTALHYTVTNQNKMKSLWLMEQSGIDVTLKDGRGRTPAMLAAIIVAEEGRSSLLDADFVETLRNKEVEQIRQKMEAGDPDLPPGLIFTTPDNE